MYVYVTHNLRIAIANYRSTLEIDYGGYWFAVIRGISLNLLTTYHTEHAVYNLKGRGKLGTRDNGFYHTMCNKRVSHGRETTASRFFFHNVQ